MKIILGDNQFFGINHYDLKKGIKNKNKFNSVDSINDFINDSLGLGLDGFMINSNQLGYKLISDYNFDSFKEIHYTIPYPHKFAAIVNESGFMSLLNYAYKNSSFLDNIKSGLKLLKSKNLIHLTSLGINLEVPKSFEKGNYIYLQNIITDLLIGIKRYDIIIEFIIAVSKLGYKPGLITINPCLLNKILMDNLANKYFKDLIICMNINKEGFKVFPSLKQVEKLISSNLKYKIMGMSIFSSGGSQINESINYIKSLNLDYIVFGSSNLTNIENNYNLLKN